MGEVTILSVVYDQHFDKDGKKTGEDRCQQTDGKIPSSIAGYPVTEIAGGAYANCINMTEVVIPSTVKRVEREASAAVLPFAVFYFRIMELPSVPVFFRAVRH